MYTCWYIGRLQAVTKVQHPRILHSTKRQTIHDQQPQQFYIQLLLLSVIDWMTLGGPHILCLTLLSCLLPFLARAIVLKGLLVQLTLNVLLDV